MRNQRTGPARLFAEIGLFWLLPASLALSAWLWVRLPWMTAGMLVYLLLVPTVAMTITVAIGAGLLRLWRFNLAYTMHGVAPQIGLIYAAVVNLVMVGFAGLLNAPGLFSGLAFVLLVAVFAAILGVLYDLVAVHFGFLEVYVRAHYRKQGTWAIVRSYGFQFFGLVGLLVAASTSLGFQLLVEPGGAPWWQAFLLGVAIIVLPCVVVCAAIYRRRLQRAHSRSLAANNPRERARTTHADP